MFCIEALILFFHIPPGIDFIVHGNGFLGLGDFHINYLNVFCIVRAYLFLRVMRNHSGFYSEQIHFIGSLQGIDTNSIVFNFRMLLKEKPGHILIPLFCVTAAVTALPVCMFERIAHNPKIESYGDALWMTVITISTVGYGDEYPVRKYIP